MKISKIPEIDCSNIRDTNSVIDQVSRKPRFSRPFVLSLIFTADAACCSGQTLFHTIRISNFNSNRFSNSYQSQLNTVKKLRYQLPHLSSTLDKMPWECLAGSLMCRAVPLNKYEPDPYFLQIFQSNTMVCLIICVFL